MATLLKKSYTQKLPKGTEIVELDGVPMAMWQDRFGHKHCDKITQTPLGTRIIRKTAKWHIQYRKADGQLVVRTSGCRDRMAAMAVMMEIVTREEKIKAKLLNADDLAMADEMERPLLEHMEEWLEHLENRDITQGRVKANRQRLTKVTEDCHWRQLGDMQGLDLERWMAWRRRENMSAGTRNAYREACVGFANWCVREKRLKENPLQYVVKANTRIDCRRKRRALTKEEIYRLLDAARKRPLANFQTISRGKDKGKRTAKISDATRERLLRLGWGRSLIYKTLLLTGLRLNELRSITVGQVILDSPTPHLVLYAADEKNRQGSNIPLRTDLAEEIGDWLAKKEAYLSRPLKMKEKLFHVTLSMLQVFNKDLEFAGIAKRDERGRTVDLHALRHTFGTHLAMAGVAPRIAMAAMRHSSLNLTMNVYTDPALLDVAGAINALPDMSNAGVIS